MARDCYVYYKLAEHEAAALYPRVQALLAAMRAHCRDCALLRRPQPAGGCWTWMERYHDTGAGFEAALAVQVQALGLETLPRHVEWFEDFDTAG
jgi:hypothetical protein